MNPSLLMIPDEVKAGTVFTQIPNTALGDLDFTRVGDTATRVNEAGLIENVLANIPRIDYTGGGCGKLLLEPQRTNISGFFESGNGNFVTAVVTNPSNPTSILGRQTFRVQSNFVLGDAPHIINQSNYISGLTYTASALLDLNQTDSPSIEIAMFGFGSPTGGASVVLDVSTKTITATATPSVWSNVTGLLTHVLGSVYKIEVRATSLQNLSGSRAYLLATTDLCFIQCACIQVEQGNGSTSFIAKPTFALVTRGADFPRKTGIAALIGQPAGAIGGKFEHKGTSGTLLSVSDETTDNVFHLYTTETQLVLDVNVGGASQASLSRPIAIGNVGFCIRYVGDLIQLYINNGVIEQSGSLIPSTSAFYLGSLNGVADFFNGRVEITALYNVTISPELANEISEL